MQLLYLVEVCAATLRFPSARTTGSGSPLLVFLLVGLSLPRLLSTFALCSSASPFPTPRIFAGAAYSSPHELLHSDNDTTFTTVLGSYAHALVDLKATSTYFVPKDDVIKDIASIHTRAAEIIEKENKTGVYSLLDVTGIVNGSLSTPPLLDRDLQTLGGGVLKAPRDRLSGFIHIASQSGVQALVVKANVWAGKGVLHFQDEILFPYLTAITLGGDHLS